jgi:hypothetical protein
MYVFVCPMSFSLMFPHQFLSLVRDAYSRNTILRRSEWGSILPVGCFASRGSIWPVNIVSASLYPEAGGTPLVGCPRLLIQCIRSCPPYRRPFVHPQNLRTRHAVVTGTHKHDYISTKF